MERSQALFFFLHPYLQWVAELFYHTKWSIPEEAGAFVMPEPMMYIDVHTLLIKG